MKRAIRTIINREINKENVEHFDDGSFQISEEVLNEIYEKGYSEGYSEGRLDE